MLTWSLITALALVVGALVVSTMRGEPDRAANLAAMGGEATGSPSAHPSAPGTTGADSGSDAGSDALNDAAPGATDTGSDPVTGSAETRGSAADPLSRAVLPTPPQTGAEPIGPTWSPYQVVPGRRIAVDWAERRRMKIEAEAARLKKLRKVSAFRVASLNVLGSNHTMGAGGYGPGTARAAREAGLIRSRGIDLIGLQEVQRDQRPVFISGLPQMTIWPQDALGNQGYRLQIAYNSARFEMLDGGSVTHTWIGMQVPIPWLLLRDRESKATFYVINAHNAPGGQQASRETSTSIEVALVNQLKATGRPVLMVGDMNEKASFFCRISSATAMVSANGGSWSQGCRMPAGELRIDWILGAGEVGFSNYVQDGTTRTTGMSDHYLVYSDVELVDSTDPAKDGENQ